MKKTQASVSLSLTYQVPQNKTVPHSIRKWRTSGHAWFATGFMVGLMEWTLHAAPGAPSDPRINLDVSHDSGHAAGSDGDSRRRALLMAPASPSVKA